MNIPIDLDSAVQLLTEMLPKEELKKVEDPSSLHFGIGMSLRNRWKLWEQSTPLVQWFIRNLQIGHADDISGIILSKVWAEANQKEFDLEREVEIYHKHWKQAGVDPVTGQEII